MFGVTYFCQTAIHLALFSALTDGYGLYSYNSKIEFFLKAEVKKAINDLESRFDDFRYDMSTFITESLSAVGIPSDSDKKSCMVNEIKMARKQTTKMLNMMVIGELTTLADTRDSLDALDGKELSALLGTLVKNGGTYEKALKEMEELGVVLKERIEEVKRGKHCP